MLYAENFDLHTVTTPINVPLYKELLEASDYPADKREYLVEGFTHGFRIGFYGPRDIAREAPNMHFHTGTKLDLWNKIIKEVQLGHTAGPFTMGVNFPYEYYWQNPIGLIPKKGNPNETRLIVNMSYKENHSVNHYSKKEECTVKYRDIDAAIQMISDIRAKSQQETVYLAKCDGRAAFRQIPVNKADFPLLVMKAQNPHDNKFYYFIDKVVVFGSSRSC